LHKTRPDNLGHLNAQLICTGGNNHDLGTELSKGVCDGETRHTKP
jgi:hypothetical protein